MGCVIIDGNTTRNPLQLMGIKAGTCWGANIHDKEKNIKRAVDCLQSGHKRVAEYPQVFIDLRGYSIAVIREFYTHIGGAPTRLQESTRYVDFSKGFTTVKPPQYQHNEEIRRIIDYQNKNTLLAMQKLKELGVKREDYTKLLPLSTTTNVCVRMGLLELIQIAQVRLCSRAYWEFREMMTDIIQALALYSEEWAELIQMDVFAPKCKVIGYCTESHSCGRVMTKEQAMKVLSKAAIDEINQEKA